MTVPLPRQLCLLLAASLFVGCGSGINPDADEVLETGEPQAIGVCNYPLCSSTCTCGASCSAPCCVTTAGPQVTCYSSTYSCAGKLGCTCGNGVCDPGENSLNCYKDCPECMNPGTSTTSCGYSCNKPAATEDRDADGIPDQLEYLLAHKFFPSMVAVYPYSDRAMFYLQPAPSTSTVPYTARFQPIVPKTGPCSASKDMCIEIVYGMAYHFDCGAFPANGCSGLTSHLGDSEFYIALAKRNSAWSTAKSRPADWQLIGDFTSAHFGENGGICPAESSDAARYGVNGKDCFTLYGYNASACLADSECKMNYMSTPHCENNCGSIGLGARSSYTTLYVSQGKHAMYHSVSACSGGGCAGTDSCNANSGIDLRSGKTCFNLQNVGNSNDSTAFKRKIRTPNTSTDGYNVWGGLKFGDASPYLRPFQSTVAWCMN